MIKITQKGDLSRTINFLKNSKKIINISELKKCGEEGVAALSAATPIDTGLTANSWYYEIIEAKETTSIIFKNSNIQNGVPIAIILQYGHGTGTGGWVEGRDYINPAIQPIFDKILERCIKKGGV